MHIVFVASAASKNVNEKIKTQTSSPPFVGGYMRTSLSIGIGIEKAGIAAPGAQTYQVGACFEALIEGVHMVTLDSTLKFDLFLSLLKCAR